MCARFAGGDRPTRILTTSRRVSPGRYARANTMFVQLLSAYVVARLGRFHFLASAASLSFSLSLLCSGALAFETCSVLPALVWLLLYSSFRRRPVMFRDAREM